MQLLVETYLDGGVEKLRRIRFDAGRIEITDNIDQWHGADYRYFKVRGSDGNLYMVRYDEIRAAWELTMTVPATLAHETGRPRCGDGATWSIL